MKDIITYLSESLNEQVNNSVTESKIESEKDFREAAEKKFQEVFGDELDEKKMNETIDGLLEDNKELVEDGKWGELMGMLNKSFNESEENEEEASVLEACKKLDSMSEDELWDCLGNIHKIKDEKEREKMFNDVKQKLQSLKNEK